MPRSDSLGPPLHKTTTFPTVVHPARPHAGRGEALTITKYVLYDADGQPVGTPAFDTLDAALAASKSEDEPTAVMEYEFEFADSSLVDPRYDVWPPQ